MLTTSLLWFFAAVTADEDTLRGSWRDTERGALVAFTRDETGAWSGTIVDSPRKAEVGKHVYRGLVFDPTTKTWTGALYKPEDDQRVNVVVRLKEKDTLEAVARVFIFSKTLTLKRE